MHLLLPHGGPQPLPPARVPQVLQDLINVLPVSAKIPSEVDVELQTKRISHLRSDQLKLDELLCARQHTGGSVPKQWCANERR